MRPTKVICWMVGEDEEVEVDGFTTATSGLVVNPDPVRDDSWNITHEASGACVLRFSDPETAMKAAEQLGAHADWTQSGAEIHQQLGTNREELFNKLRSGGFTLLNENLHTGPPVPPHHERLTR